MADLEVFVSWSRPASHQAAGAFKEWLPGVLPGVRPWMSSEDITKGTPWFSSISSQLSRSGACLILVTPENVGSSWLFYEAGAIAHAMQGALICPYLVDVKAGELSGTPLGQYQVTVFDKGDTWLLVRALNDRLAAPHHADVLRGNFDTKWPLLQCKLAQVAAAAKKPPDEPDEVRIQKQTDARQAAGQEADKRARSHALFIKLKHELEDLIADSASRRPRSGSNMTLPRMESEHREEMKRRLADWLGRARDEASRVALHGYLPDVSDLEAPGTDYHALDKFARRLGEYVDAILGRLR